MKKEDMLLGAICLGVASTISSCANDNNFSFNKLLYVFLTTTAVSCVVAPVVNAVLKRYVPGLFAEPREPLNDGLPGTILCGYIPPAERGLTP